VGFAFVAVSGDGGDSDAGRGGVEDESDKLAALPPAFAENGNGGAITLGHPVGMSGARRALTLELRRGGGQGDALILRVP
jgi:hypothetical protein